MIIVDSNVLEVGTLLPFGLKIARLAAATQARTFQNTGHMLDMRGVVVNRQLRAAARTGHSHAIVCECIGCGLSAPLTRWWAVISAPVLTDEQMLAMWPACAQDFIRAMISKCDHNREAAMRLWEVGCTDELPSGNF